VAEESRSPQLRVPSEHVV